MPSDQAALLDARATLEQALAMMVGDEGWGRTVDDIAERITEARTEACILENYRAFKRARKSLYRCPVEVGPAGQFLFEGWLRLEERSRLAVDRVARGFVAAGKWLDEPDLEQLGQSPVLGGR